jgi:MoxR-like ATPase
VTVGVEQPAEEAIDQLQAAAAAIEQQLGNVIVGHHEVLRGVMVALLANGHALVEGAPGLGKTLLVRTLARALHLHFSRVQFTPDLMPADILGTNVLMETPEGERRFVFQHGPIFANLLLADEINRASPKTQSALLEAMQEQTVTVSTSAYPLPRPFFVLATQNPIEMAGTYPLPEAQLDRFLFKLRVEFPSPQHLTEILERTTSTFEPRVEQVADGDTLVRMQHLVREVPIASHVMNYAARLVMATHATIDGAPAVVREAVRYGASPRAAQGLVLAAKAHAFLAGRFNVSYQDIKAVAYPALRHRLILRVEAAIGGLDAETVVGAVLAHVPEESR